MDDKPQVTKYGMLSLQVCVPEKYTDAEVIKFAESQYPCGTTGGWGIFKDGKDPERVKCDGRSNFVHIVLNA